MIEVWGDTKKKPIKKAAAGKEDKHIAVHDNKIYFYAGVNRESAAEVNKKIDELQGKNLNIAHTLDIDYPPINIFINSGGGGVTSGLSIMDTILRCKVPVHTYVDGFCASAATFISVVGTKRYMSKNSYMLIHQLSSQLWGKYSEIEDEKKNLDLMMTTIKNIYRDYTKVPTKKLDEILKHDLMWDANTCLKYGMIDEIV
tara:strand:+ start:7089 stop:7688 length:600 start_codon:yes stop_codon:yes gene_type:complete